MRFEATVERTVLDTVSLVVVADSAQEGHRKVKEVLESYPAAHEVEGVPYVYTENREIVASRLVKITREK